MILTELRDYLKQNTQASLMDLAYRFQTEPEVIRSMVAKWVKKGMVKKIDAPAQQCTGCTKCEDKKNEAYQWTAGSILSTHGKI